jgi:hypothetical protein
MGYVDAQLFGPLDKVREALVHLSQPDTIRVCVEIHQSTWELKSKKCYALNAPLSIVVVFETGGPRGRGIGCTPWRSRATPCPR